MCVHLICSIWEFRWFCCHIFNLSQRVCVCLRNKWLPLLYIIWDFCANDGIERTFSFTIKFQFIFFSHAEIDWMKRRWSGSVEDKESKQNRAGEGEEKRQRTSLITHIYIPIPDVATTCTSIVCSFIWYFPCSTKCFLFFFCHFQWNICLCVIISWHICLVICKFFSE